MTLAVFLQYVMPHQFFSRLAYFVARIEWPPFKNWLILLVIKKFNVNMSEAEVSDPLSYKSFNKFFTRALKPGARVADSDPNSLLIPADGKISQVGRIKDGDIFQAKGHSFTAAELLGDEEAAKQQGHEQNHLDKTLHTQLLEIHGPGVHKNDLYIKKHEENRHQKVLNRNGCTGIPDNLDAALEGIVLQLAFPTGTNVVGNDHGTHNKSRRQYKLNDYR